MFDVRVILSLFMLFSDVTTGPSVLSWPDQMCFLTLAREHTSTWRSNMSVCPTVRIPAFSSYSPSQFTISPTQQQRLVNTHTHCILKKKKKRLQYCHPVYVRGIIFLDTLSPCERWQRISGRRSEYLLILWILWWCFFTLYLSLWLLVSSLVHINILEDSCQIM